MLHIKRDIARTKAKILFEANRINYISLSNVSQCTHAGNGMYSVSLYTGGYFNLNY